MEKILLILTIVVTQNSYGAVCESLTDCQKMGAKILARKTEIQKIQTKFLEPPREGGRLKLMTYPEVKSYCVSQSARVPTLREMLIFAMKHTPIAIGELSEARPAEAEILRAYSADGYLEDEFYKFHDDKAPDSHPPYAYSFVPLHYHAGYQSRGFWNLLDGGYIYEIPSRRAMYDDPDYNALCVSNETSPVPPGGVCNSLVECENLRKAVVEQMSAIRSQKAFRFIEGPTEPNGEQKRMTLAEGFQFCKSKNGHLASAYELGDFVRRFKLNNFKMREILSGSKRSDFFRQNEMIRTIERDGSVDGFFYESIDYNQSSTDNRPTVYLTSSRDGIDLKDEVWVYGVMSNLRREMGFGRSAMDELPVLKGAALCVQ